MTRLRNAGLFILILVFLVTGTIEPAFEPAPYGPGNEWKNGTHTDDLSTGVVNNAGAYVNVSIVRSDSTHTWNVTGAGWSYLYLKNVTYNSTRIHWQAIQSASSGNTGGLILCAESNSNSVFNTGNRYIVNFQIYSGTLTFSIQKIINGVTSTVASQTVASRSYEKLYNIDCYFNSTANFLNCSTDAAPGVYVMAPNMTEFDGGYIGFATVGGTVRRWGNISIESPPGAGAPWMNGVNLTNRSGYPLQVDAGTTIILDDLTTRQHTINPFHTTTYGGDYLSNLSCDNATCWQFTDSNDWWIGNDSNPNTYHYTTENATVDTTGWAAGTYDVGLTVRNGYGMNTTNKSDYITINGGTGVAAPVADFDLISLGHLLNSYNATHKNASIMADDKTTNTPTSCLWYPKGSKLPAWLNASGCGDRTFFPHGTGRYTLCLMATNAGGSDTTCKAFFIIPPTGVIL